MSILDDLRMRSLELARSFLGIRELTANRGPLIDEWNARVGAPVGSPWCMSFVLGACYLPAWRALMEPVEGPKPPPLLFPLPITAKVSRFWRRCPDHMRSPVPVIGGIYCHASHPEDPESPGHTGICLSSGGNHIVGIEGNTDDAGGREGIEVAPRMRRLEYVNLGWIDVARTLGPEDPTPVPIVR